MIRVFFAFLAPVPPPHIMNQLQENGAAAVLSSSSSSSTAVGNTVASRGGGTAGVPTPQQQASKANEFLGISKSIQQTGDVPPPRFGHTCTCVGNHKVVVFGGAVGCKRHALSLLLSFLFISSPLLLSVHLDSSFETSGRMHVAHADMSLISFFLGGCQQFSTRDSLRACVCDGTRFFS